MKERVFLCVILVMIFSTLPVSSIYMECICNIPIDSQSTILSETIPHSPIVINHNDNFTMLGFPGSGSQSNPYRIEGLRINSSDACINITGTSVSFIIQDCILTQTHDSLFGVFGVLLRNVSNCVITSCDINVDYWAICMSRCQNCSVYNSDIKGNDACIVIGDSEHCTVSFNTLHEHLGAGLYFDSCNYSVAQGNIVNGNRHGQTGIAAFGSAYHCTISDNIISGHFGKGIYLDDIECLVQNNTITENGFGVYAYDNSEDCIITLNRIVNSTLRNTYDSGSNNSWVSNWYDDYIGIGSYSINGPAQSVDSNPKPQNVSLMVIIIVVPISIIVVIMSGLWYRYRRN